LIDHRLGTKLIAVQGASVASCGTALWCRVEHQIAFDRLKKTGTASQNKRQFSTIFHTIHLLYWDHVVPAKDLNMWQVNEFECTNKAEAVQQRLEATSAGLDQMLRVIDEIDYGILVVNAQGEILHANHLSRHELLSGHFLASVNNRLTGRSADLCSQVELGLAHARRGQRKLVFFDSSQGDMPVVFIPLTRPLQTDSPNVLVLLTRQSACENLAVRMYARAQRLSPSEEAVMIGLCRGLEVSDIARANGVAQSTVRSQVKSLREKTGCASIRRLIQRIHSLPPVVPALRSIAPIRHSIPVFVHP
jgi:DNA-binding CsgD family transcriptional regulator